MIKLSRRFVLKASAASVTTAVLPNLSIAQTAYTAADLNGALTPFGAVKAGNADGTIPPWTGGFTKVPAGYQQGDPRPLPDFLQDKQIISITGANMAQYADKLTPGVQAMLQKYPDYNVQVYPTHRTAAAPQYVYDYTYKNALNTKLSDDGNSVLGAYGGMPFPIPKDGHEVMWNHLLAWAGVSIYQVGDAYTVTSSGQIVLEARVKVWSQRPYFIENGENNFNGLYLESLVDPVAPPYEAGGMILLRQPVNEVQTPVEGYEYLLGERRVRTAPELQFDTPNSLAGGTTNWDEGNIFFGKLIEYDCNYLGVKEFYVPYNTNKAWNATKEEQLLPHFLSPDLTRWELHRMRVVELTVKTGYRNVDARRMVYCDEDSGQALMGEVYDASGSLWKCQHMMAAVLPDVPCLSATQFFVTYDLHSAEYSIGFATNTETQPTYKLIPLANDSFFSAQELSAKAGGF